MSRGSSGNFGFGIAIGGGLISAVLLWFAYPPIAVFPLALVAYTPLLNRGPDLGARARFIVGWVHGICFQAALFYWLPQGLEQARGVDTLTAFQVFGKFVAFQGLFSGAYLWGLGFLGWRNSPVPFALGAAALFALLETVFPFIIPVPYGGVLYRIPTLVQVVEVGGVALPSFLLIFSSALLARSLAPHGAGRVVELWPWVVAVLAICLVLAGYGSWRLSGSNQDEAADGSSPVESSVVLGIVQPNIPVALNRQNNISSRAAILDLTLGVEGELEEGAHFHYAKPLN